LQQAPIADFQRNVIKTDQAGDNLKWMEKTKRKRLMAEGSVSKERPSELT